MFELVQADSPAEPWEGADEQAWRDWETGHPEALLPTMADTAPSGLFALEVDLATAGPRVLADADLVDGIVGLERIAAWARARQYALIAEFARRPGDGTIRAARDPARMRAGEIREWAEHEIGLALTLAPGSAGARLADAHRLDGVLRPTRDLLAAGRLDDSRARLVCTMLATLDDDLAAAVQARVLPAAPGQTWGQLRSALRRAILALDTEGAAQRHRRAARARRVDLFPGEDGMATLWACLPAVDAAASFAWITRLARGLHATCPHGRTGPHAGTGGNADPAGNTGTGGNAETDTPCGCPGTAGSIDARRADVLTALLTGRLQIVDPDGTPTVFTRPVGADRPLIQVTVPITTLTGDGDEPAELAGHGPLPAHLAREIAADPRSTWRRLLTDPASGLVLDHGRTTYRPPAGLADLVRTRDGTCRHPTCTRPVTGCELDHVTAWQHGGTTSEDNLVGLCTRHHHLKEHPGWQVVLHPDRTMEWITPTGHRYRSTPVDHRIPDTPATDRTARPSASAPAPATPAAPATTYDPWGPLDPDDPPGDDPAPF